MFCHSLILKICYFVWVILAARVWVGCTPKENSTWQVYFDKLGTYSSPRVADLNLDGVGDIIMGAGGKEERYSDSAVIALDGRTGRLLWAVGGVNQFVGSAVLYDITGDRVPDVFIGGRWAEFAAINGATGEVIWRFLNDRLQPDPSGLGWFNFSTAQLIPDQDNDGFNDLVVANGGNPRAAPHDTNRLAGRLLVLSSKTGDILSDATMPDKGETYMSVVCYRQPGRQDLFILFGTGGETIGGKLYRATLADVKRGDLSNAKVLASSDSKGFVAAPVVADVNLDGIFDVIANQVNGRVMVFDGRTDSLLWSKAFPGTEAYTTPVIGYFTNDKVPDVFCNFAIGTFPNLPKSVRFLLDGKSGDMRYVDTIPAFQYASAVAADLDGDGFDEAIVNQSAMRRTQFAHRYFSFLQVFDFARARRYVIGDKLDATNFASTPWIGDLDHDRQLDVVYTAVNFQGLRFDLDEPQGLFVSRLRTNVVSNENVRWGGYMGSRGDGVFDRNNGE